MPKALNLTGQEFGHLKAMSIADKGPRTWYLCLCDCGKECVIPSQQLRSGFRKSCGCRKHENYGKHALKHGHAPTKGRPGSRTYKSWQSMKSRCLNTSSYGFQYYGGRGIKFCDSWADFSCFLADMGERPQGTELDREDNNGNYCKENCRWVTHTKNNRNKENNHIIDFNGEKLCLAEWAEKTGIGWNTLYYRIYRCNWPVGKAMTTPVNRINIEPPTQVRGSN